jgi:o-succinylbenzoate synthase
MMIEQPLEYDDVMDHAALQRHLRTPICLDESIHTVRIARDAIAGRPAASSTSSRGVWAGTSSPSSCTTSARLTASRSGTAGCSRAASAARTTSTWRACRTSRLPGDIAASKRYYAPDLIEPGIDIGADGTIAVPDGPASA